MYLGLFWEAASVRNFTTSNINCHIFHSGTGSTVLGAGRHVFPFVYQLPMNLPSSYESHIGHVRYQLKGTIDKPWKFDHHTKKVFTVVSMLDLNQQPSAPVRTFACYFLQFFFQHHNICFQTTPRKLLKSYLVVYN